jgi:hypothetical protein
MTSLGLVSPTGLALAWRSGCFVVFSLTILSFSFFSSFLSSLVFSIQLDYTER